jgi:dihydroorotase
MTVYLRYTLVVMLLHLGVQAQQYELIIKGGRLIDPRNKIDAMMDVAVGDGVIQEVSRNIASSEGQTIIDAQGLIVAPGLIDIHTHVFVGEKEKTFASGFSSVSPDDFTLKAGITTVVDAGTSGWRSFPKFKEEVIDRSKTRVLVFLNITGAGMIGSPDEENLDDMDVAMTVKAIQEYPEIIVGTKIGHYRGDQWTPFDKAVAVGTKADVPMILECHLPELPLEMVLEKMRPGDIFTHTYGAVNDRNWLLDDQGSVQPYVWEARKKGVYFDVGHGGGSFHYSLAVPALEQGFYPDSFGTDLHRFSMNAGMKDMLNVMSKFLNMGMPLEDVIYKATWSPAKMIKRDDLGHLSEGAEADIAILRVREGQFGYIDADGFKINGDKRLEAELTIRAGKIAWDLNGISAKKFK